MTVTREAGKIKETRREMYNATNCPPPAVLLYLLHEHSRRSIHHPISGANRPQGQRPLGATRVLGHPPHLHHSEQSEATRHHPTADPDCAFRASPHEAAAQRPSRPRPTRRSHRPSRHRQGNPSAARVPQDDVIFRRVRWCG